ncbi:MAG: hypothetical protein ACRCSL_15500 [Microbacterium sp.]|jgi:hypothetical protein
MDHQTTVGYRMAQQRLADHARDVELRRRIAERRAAEDTRPVVARAAIVEPRWHRLLVRVHLARPVTA